MKLWNRVRFWGAFLGGKLFLASYRRQGRLRNDRPGMVSMRLCGDFLKYIAKPKLLIVVTGTNGKTSIASMAAQILQSRGLTVSYNDWGANHHAGVARCLLDAVSWRNRPVKDAAVIEMDELISPLDVPDLKPQYIIVSNLFRDSMLRNGYPEFIRQRLQTAIDRTPNATVILNGDDPLSCFLGEYNRRFTFGIAPSSDPYHRPLADDFPVCPRCGEQPEYSYRTYRHLGQFRCPQCGLESPARDYFVEKMDLDAKTIQVRHGQSTSSYPIPSHSPYTASNAAALIPMFLDMGMTREELASSLSGVHMPPSRESVDSAKGIALITLVAKGQNAPAVSTALRAVRQDPAPKEVVLLLDEVYHEPGKMETAAWLYDTDFELLNHPSVRRIILGGARYLDHRVRLLLAGIPPEKLVCVRQELDTPQYVSTQGVERIYILHDVNAITRGRQVRDQIKANILSGEAVNP